MGSDGLDGGRGQRRFRLVLIISDGHVILREEVRRSVRMLNEKVVLVALLNVRKKGTDTEHILNVMRVQYFVQMSRAA